MRNDARIVLLVVLPLLVLLPFLLAAGGGLGSVEMGVWLLLLIAWGVAFRIWGRRRRSA